MSIYEHFSKKELEILRARAERVVSTSTTDIQGDVVTALTIRVGGETYALPIETLTAVYDNARIVPAPGAPPFVAGIANIRGHILPVLDLAVLLGLPGGTAQKIERLVVSANAELTIAFRVETIGEVTTFVRGQVAALSADLTAAHNAYLQGILPNGMALLDVEAILNDPALIVDEIVG